MHFTTTFSVLALAASGMVSASAVPHVQNFRRAANETAACIDGLLCCPGLKTPLDPILDPILGLLGINGSALVGSVGLLCMSDPDPLFADLLRDLLTSNKTGDPAGSTCPASTELTCCSEINLLGGTVALGCSPV